MLLLSLILALLGPSATPAPGGGRVVGRVTVVKGGAALADASNTVVWIDRAHAAAGAPLAHSVMKSLGKRFVPRVVAVSKSAEVDFPNMDSIFHNVFSVSPSNRFDLGLYRSGGSKGKRFDEPGVVRVYCNIHPQMVGFVLVADSDFTAVTGPDGTFRFENVPPGAWEVKAWNEEGGEGHAPAAVRTRGEASVVVRLDATEFKPLPHKNKYGKDYPPQAASDDERY